MGGTHSPRRRAPARAPRVHISQRDGRPGRHRRPGSPGRPGAAAEREGSLTPSARRVGGKSRHGCGGERAKAAMRRTRAAQPSDASEGSTRGAKRSNLRNPRQRAHHSRRESLRARAGGTFSPQLAQTTLATDEKATQAPVILRAALVRHQMARALLAGGHRLGLTSDSNASLRALERPLTVSLEANARPRSRRPPCAGVIPRKAGLARPVAERLTRPSSFDGRIRRSARPRPLPGRRRR